MTPPIQQSLSPEEQRLFRLYGKLPSRTDRLAKHLKERKYFDSGDYALSKAGKANSVDTGAVGSEHPVPENIPHLSTPVGAVGANNGVASTTSIGTATISGLAQLHTHFSHLGPGSVPPGAAAGSPVKESSFLQRATSADDLDNEDNDEEEDGEENGRAPEKQVPASGPGSKDAIPIRR